MWVGSRRQRTVIIASQSIAIDIQLNVQHYLCVILSIIIFLFVCTGSISAAVYINESEFESFSHTVSGWLQQTQRRNIQIHYMIATGVSVISHVHTAHSILASMV